MCRLLFMSRGGCTVEVMEKQIIRTPVKIRKSVHREYCKCWGLKPFVINGIPHYLSMDGVSIDTVQEFLSSSDRSIGIYSSEPIEQSHKKILRVLDHGLPVTIRVNHALPETLLDTMHEVPHCAIHFYINHLDKSIKKSWQSMMAQAKTQKVSVMLEAEYTSHLMKKLDIFEMIEDCKNYIDHVMLYFPVISDVELLDYKNEWDMEKFKSHYAPEIKDRSWELKHRVKHDMIKSLEIFTRYKSLGFEVLDKIFYLDDRVKLETRGLSDLPTGMRLFSYTKVNGKYEENKMEVFTCNRCSKNLFI